MSRLKPALIKCNAIKTAWSKQSNMSAAHHTEPHFHRIRALMGKDETTPPSSEQKNV